jgi:hypothetical protein
VDLVTPEETGLLFEPNDMTALRVCVLRLAADAELRAAWGAKGRISVEHRSWTAVGDELLRHYAEVCRERVLHEEYPIAQPEPQSFEAQVIELNGEGRKAAAA